IEDNVIAKTRRALFGEDFAPYYEILKNRLVFLDGGKDDFFFLEHYVLLGNYARDPDRLEAMDALFHEFLKEAGANIPREQPKAPAADSYKALFAEAEHRRAEIVSLEEQRELLRKKLERGDGLLNKFLSSTDPAEMRASVSGIEARLKVHQTRLEELAPQLDRAKQQVDFVNKDYRGKIDDYLNEPENARRLFDASFAEEGDRAARTHLLTQLLNRLEERELIVHILASYEIRPIASDFCPPVHLQQLRKALVSREEAKRVEELTRRMRRYSRDELQGVVLRFAIDFFRMRHDLRDAEHLSACMERVNLI